MIRAGLWQPAGLDRFACVPDGRVRKRAARIGLVDLDEKADAIDDMKAVSAACTRPSDWAATARARTSTCRCRRPSSAARCATGSAWPNAPCPTAATAGRPWAATEGGRPARGMVRPGQSARPHPSPAGRNPIDSRCTFTMTTSAPRPSGGCRPDRQSSAARVYRPRAFGLNDHLCTTPVVTAGRDDRSHGGTRRRARDDGHRDRRALVVGDAVGGTAAVLPSLSVTAARAPRRGRRRRCRRAPRSLHGSRCRRRSRP